MRWALNSPISNFVIKDKQVVFISAKLESYNYDLHLNNDGVVLQSRASAGSLFSIKPITFPNTVNYYNLFLVEGSEEFELLSTKNICLKFENEVALEDLINSSYLFGVFMHA